MPLSRQKEGKTTIHLLFLPLFILSPRLQSRFRRSPTSELQLLLIGETSARLQPTANSRLIYNATRQTKYKVFLYSIIFFTLKFCFANMSMIALSYSRLSPHKEPLPSFVSAKILTFSFPTKSLPKEFCTWSLNRQKINEIRHQFW